MKVFTIGETKDVRSGWGRYAFEVIEQYKKNNIDCTFLSSKDLLTHQPKNLFRNVLRVRKIIREEKPDIIHAFDVWPFAVYAVLANTLINIPFFITGVGTYSVPPKTGPKAYLMRLSLRKAREVFCISRYTQSLLKKSEPTANLSIVHWGSTKLPPVIKSEEFKYKFNISEDREPILITVGQVKHRKGQLDTLKAVKMLKDKHPNILYIIVGNTEDTEYVQKIINFSKNNNLEDNLKIVNNQETDRELSFLYNLADVFVMNSNNEGLHFEGFGLVFLEGYQFGLPAVGSKGCGIEDAIQDGKTGFLTNQADVDDIASKIELILTGARNSFSEQAKIYTKKFTWEKTVEKYINVYKNHLA